MARSVASGAGIGLLLAALAACSGLSEPPPGWFKEPISRANYCPAKAETPEPVAARPQASIESALAARDKDISDCQRQAVAKNPGAYGTMKVKFVITPEGTVTDACIAEATFDDDEMARCMMRAVQAVRVEPAEGYQVVNRPFSFELQTASGYTDFPEPPRSTTQEERSFRSGSGAY